MPKALEQKLMKEAMRAGLEGNRKDAYVYGTMRKTGWTPARERNAKRLSAALRKK